MVELTNKQARRFILRKNGLIGGRVFRGKKGTLAFIRGAGCIQFDPVDLCGRNADLTLLARVSGYDKATLDALLYKDRALIDYYDKQLSIFPVENWPHFARMRERCMGWSRGDPRVEEALGRMLREVETRGPVSSRDFEDDVKVSWAWADTKLSRAALDTLYYRGSTVIHHREGNVKYYSKAEDLLPAALLNAPDPFRTEEERNAWQLERRVGAIGLLWDRPSDALLGMSLKTDERKAAFALLAREKRILPAKVEGVSATFYYKASDEPLMQEVLSGKTYASRTEFLAPLDCALWDRKLIRALFGFDYGWEIYTPAVKRKYGAYTLPVLHGDRFIARIEPVCDRKSGTLVVKNLWWEEGIRPTAAMQRGIDDALERLRIFNGMSAVSKPTTEEK